MSALFNCVTSFQSYGTGNTICMLPMDTTLFFYLKRQSWSSLRLIQTDDCITLLGCFSLMGLFLCDGLQEALVIPVQCIKKTLSLFAQKIQAYECLKCVHSSFVKCLFQNAQNITSCQRKNRNMWIFLFQNWHVSVRHVFCLQF